MKMKIMCFLIALNILLTVGLGLAVKSELDKQNEYITKVDNNQYENTVTVAHMLIRESDRMLEDK